MRFFKKKLSRDIDGNEDDGGRSKFGRGSSQNKSNPKKKVVEPWTRKERSLVLWVLLGTILISSILALSARSWKLPGFPPLSFPFFGEETIVIRNEGESAISTEDKLKAEQVISEFKKKTNELSGIYGLYVLDLGSGFSYGIYETKDFEAASLIKLPVMATLYIKAEEKEIDLDEKYSLRNEDKLPGAGSLLARPAGTLLTFRDLARLMGKQSDNTAFNIVRKKIGDEEIEKTIKQIGMINTSLEENKTTPYDIGLFFEKLWQGKIVSKEHRDEILEFLTDTAYEDWLAAGVPKDVRVAHKYGREVGVVNDAGIVFIKNPYIVVIMGKGVIGREADAVFPKLSRLVYEAHISK